MSDGSPSRLDILLTALAASLLPPVMSAYLVWQVRTTDYATYIAENGKALR